MTAHVVIRRHIPPVEGWFWVCQDEQCHVLVAHGFHYPTHADAIAGARDHLHEAAATARTTEKSTP